MPSGSAICRTCGEMRVHLAAGVVQRFQRRAGELELAAGLERDRAAADRVGEPDDVVGVEDRLPAEERLHAFEQRADAARPVIGHRRVAVLVEAELLVLGADPPFVARLAAGFEQPASWSRFSIGVSSAVSRAIVAPAKGRRT